MAWLYPTSHIYSKQKAISYSMLHRNIKFFGLCQILLAFGIKILLSVRTICFLMFFHSHLLRMYLIGNDLGGNHLGCELFVSLIRLRRGLVGRGLDDLVIFTPIILDYWNRTFRLCLNSLDVLLCRYHKIRKQTILRMNMKCDRIFLKLILQFLSTHFFKYHKLRIFLQLVISWVHFLSPRFDFHRSSMRDDRVLGITC